MKTTTKQSLQFAAVIFGGLMAAALVASSGAEANEKQPGDGAIAVIATKGGQPALCAIKVEIDGKQVSSGHQSVTWVSPGTHSVCVNDKCDTTHVTSEQIQTLTAELGK